jgi:N-acetylglucosamine malate deacetylase 1
MADFLIIAPHVDDEVLGCGGILDNRFHVHYCGVDAFHIVDRETRLQEARSCAEFLGFSFSVASNTVNRYHVSDLISPFEDLINLHRPSTVFLPYPSYNQDHRAVLDAGLTALRPHDRNYFVPNVLLYEEIQVAGWPVREDLLRNSVFQPNYFVPIDIEQKIAAYHLHSSQVRGMRSPELLTSLARWRGFQSSQACAEGFQIVRLCDPLRLSLGKLREEI